MGRITNRSYTAVKYDNAGYTVISPAHDPKLLAEVRAI
jgi:hypothetical protein